MYDISEKKMFLKFYFLYYVLIVACEGAIYTVNETQYGIMPPLFAMDDYGDCMLNPDGVYCVADFELFSKNKSDLLEFIKEYSLHTTHHFNHTLVHRAVCVSTTCKNYLRYKVNKTMDIESSLARCVNQTIWTNYGIEVDLSEMVYCKDSDSTIKIDGSDITVAVVYAVILALVVLGSFHDLFHSRVNSKKANAYLLAFSLQRNWRKLIAPAGVGPDPRLKRLKMINGLRAMTMVCVIFCHTTIVMTVTFVANPLYIEKAHDDILKQLLFNGSLVVTTFFLMSSFLLAYNLQIYSETNEVTWSQIPKGILLRWIRLTPPYALVIATISTWVRHLGDGPLWQMLVTSESEQCRQYWWANVFYFNNYVFADDLCFPQGWYLAADTQLFCFGLILLVIIQNPRARKIALSGLFTLSLIILAAHTYFEDLAAYVINSPESVREFHVNNKTYLTMYLLGHTNLSAYIQGLAAGLLAYHWQKTNVDLSRYKKYRWLVWMEFPLAVAVILSGGLFYMKGNAPSTLVRVLYSTFYKPIFQLLVVSFMVSCVFKIESVYRRIVEWRGFTWAGRLSYCAFLVHTIFQRTYVGSQVAPVYLTDYNMTVLLLASVMMSYVGAAVLWLAVEAPVAALVRSLYKPDRQDK